MSKQIEIVVVGGAGTGRSTVLGVICNALKREYGSLADVVFGDRANELTAADHASPAAGTVFLLNAAESETLEIKLDFDTSVADAWAEKAQSLLSTAAAIEPGQAATAAFTFDSLEHAIEAAVRLKADAKGADVARLGYHLEHLLALQLENLTTQYRKLVVESGWEGTIYGGNKRQAFESFVRPCVTGASLAMGSRGIETNVVLRDI